MVTLRMVVALALVFSALPARANEVVEAPTAVHPSELYAGKVWFTMPSTLCVGGWISITTTNQDLAKANYATVLAAVLSGRRLYVAYDSGTCQASYIALLAQ